MSDIKRYTPEEKFVAGEFERVEMQERHDGDWVYYEDVADLLAERDPTPVTAEWLDEVLGDDKVENPDGLVFWWIVDSGLMCVCRRSHGAFELQVDYDDAIGRTPTRGDVLTALRLFGGERK